MLYLNASSIIKHKKNYELIKFVRNNDGRVSD